jgi:hypothetical protein
MSSQKKTNLSDEMLGMPSDKDSNSPRLSKNIKKKKKSKTQSPRTETSPAFSNESDISSKKKKKKKKKKSQIDDDIDQVDAIEYNDDKNERSNSHNAPTRKKKERKEKRSLEIIDESGNAYARNDYSGSIMGSSMPSSKKHNERVRNNRQPQPMRTGSHHDNGYIEYDRDDYMSEMGNNDPVDGYGQDYDMEEDDEEEPRFKYSTADLADNGFRSTNCCLLLAGAFFILIAIVGSVLMVKLPEKNNRRLLSPRQHVRGANLSMPF